MNFSLLPRRVLGSYRADSFRVTLEGEIQARFSTSVADYGVRAGHSPDVDLVRRELLAGAMKLSESMAPALHTSAREAARVLGVESPIEIYQADGPENAAIHLIASPVVLEAQGRLLALLDEGSALALFGHELGHFLVHGPAEGDSGLAITMIRLLRAGAANDALLAELKAFSMARELTADRFALLACQDLQAFLKLGMISTTGLSANMLTWDTQAYLQQSQDLVTSMLEAGDIARGETHPEHSVRAYAAWLFSETREYRDLTGKGPGTRTLKDVDTVLARVLRAPLEDSGAGAYEPIPREAHICALAAAVLVAAADGEISEREIEALETAFGHLIREWRSFLDVEHAAAQFFASAVVVTALGTGAMHAVFSVLAHVMFADEHVSDEEVALILGIGEALQAGELFEALLASTLKAVGASRDLQVVVPASPPIPVSAGEARAALEVFLSNASRRGTRVTLRRLLRLFGQKEGSESAIRAIAEQIARSGLAASPSLSPEDLDLPIQLTPTVEYRPAERVEPPDQDRVALRRAVGRLRDELVSGDGRSPSVRLREARSGRAVDLVALDAISTGLAERVLAQVQARRDVTLYDPSLEAKMPEAKRFSSALIALAREQKARVEETGADDLYVGYPFLAGAVDGYVVRGPLVLYPVSISLDARGVRRYALAPKEDEPIVNQSLLRLIFHKRKQPFSDALAQRLDQLAAEPGATVDALMEELRASGIHPARTRGELHPLRDDLQSLEAAHNVFRLDEVAVLGLFPQSSSTLLQEYDATLGALEDTSRSLTEVLGAASLLLPAKLRPAANSPRESSEPVRPAIFADPSQREVVRRARSAPALVVDGPPGTGKSQVIANLVTDSLARGERVAIVCEKRAALDVVVQRLDQLGLRPLLGLVHDVHEDRRALLAQVAHRLEQRHEHGLDEPALSQVEQHAAFSGRELARRAELLGGRARDDIPTLGQLHTIEASFECNPLERAPSLVHLNAAQVQALLDRIEDAEAYRDLLDPRSELRRLTPALGRVDFSGATPDAVRGVVSKLARGAEAGRALEAYRHELQPIAAVRSAGLALQLASEVDGSLVGGATRALFARAAVLMRTTPSSYADVIQTLSTLGTAMAAAVSLRVPTRIEASFEVTRALSVLSHWSSKFTRFFSLQWWRARSEVKNSLLVLAPERMDQALDVELVRDLLQRIRASVAWKGLDAILAKLDLRQLTPLDAGQLDTRVNELGTAAGSVARLHEHHSTLVAIDAWPDGDLASWRQRVDARKGRLVADASWRESITALRPLFTSVSESTSTFDLASARDCLAREGARIGQADAAISGVARALKGCNDSQAVAESIRLLDMTLELPSSAARSHAMYKTWSRQQLAHLEARSAEAGILATTADDERRSAVDLNLYEDERSRHATNVVWAKCESAPLLTADVPSKHQRRTQLQALREEMLKEAKKQRNTLPLRTYVQRYADKGVLDVVPVWLLSPETMVTLFPAQPLFDLVIFDEASQCTVANGFPVLSRAKRFVVAGDDKQMPPSAFFSAKASVDDEDEPESEVLAAKTMLEDESLLTLAAARIERRSLSWHYRCRHESLIAFSNAAFYSGLLRTIPSPHGPASAPAIRWTHVSDATYSEGVNVVEAERVVDVTAELLHRPERPTIGIVTFNLKQRAAILDAIDARCASSSTFAEAWDRAASHVDLDQRPFVKNLEQVQGDERDVIVFSLGHAPVKRKLRSGGHEDYVPARFGPLGQTGGERRLNVAISRAKQEIQIVASFAPRLLNTAKAKNRGPGLFKGYLEYAFHVATGNHANATRMLSVLSEQAGVPSSVRNQQLVPGFLPLEAQLAASLQERGLRCERDVGVSGFRVPLAVYGERDQNKFKLALLVDDGSQPVDIFETHVHRPRVLAQRGWEVLRVTAPEWNRARERVLARIEGAVREKAAVGSGSTHGSRPSDVLLRSV